MRPVRLLNLRAVLLCGALGLLLAALPAAHAAADDLDPPFRGSKLCNRSFYPPELVLPVTNLRQRGGTCRRARKRLAGATSDPATGRVTVPRMRCRTHRALYDGSVLRCRKGDFVVQFYFGA
jgi:hypothetical protein